jgi:hypothetical protein
VGIKELDKLVQEYETAAQPAAMQGLLNKLRGKPFYVWDKSKRILGLNSFNEIIGLPKKNGIPQPLWDYQKMIYRALLIPNYLNSRPIPEYPLLVQIKTCMD